MSPSLICISCGSHQFQNHFRGLVRCLSCGHIVADLDLAAINFKDIYSKDYFDHGEYLDYVKDRQCFEKNFKKRLQSIRRFQPEGRLLEIGSASGFFLNMSRPYFQTTGYEICEDMAHYARKEFGLDIKSSDFLSDTIEEKSFDIVAMWDVIEHLSHPDQFVEKINRILKKGGVIALTTGDIGSMMAQIQGPAWRLIHPPTHVHYFSKHSIRKFLTRYGFEVVDISYPGYYRSLRQMAHGILGQNKKAWKHVDESPWAAAPVYLNLFDIMQVVAKKV